MIERQVEPRTAAADVGDEMLHMGHNFRIISQHCFEPLGFPLCCLDRGALRQPEIDQQFGPIRGRKKLLFDTANKSRDRSHKSKDRQPDHPPAMLKAAIEKLPVPAIERGLINPSRVGLGGGAQTLDVECAVADVGGEHHGNHPGCDQRDGDHREQGKGVFARAAFGKRTGGESGGGNQRPGQHRKGGGGVGESRGPDLVVALLDFDHHHFDRNDRVINQQPQRDNQCTERYPLQIDAEQAHPQKAYCQHQRDRQGDDHAGSPTERNERNGQDDDHRLQQGAHELVDRSLDHGRLIGHFLHRHADWQGMLESNHRRIQVATEREDVTAFGHRHSNTDPVATLPAKPWPGRVG